MHASTFMPPDRVQPESAVEVVDDEPVTSMHSWSEGKSHATVVVSPLELEHAARDATTSVAARNAIDRERSMVSRRTRGRAR